ncbi:glutamate receptor, metabotropic 5 [Trichuris trichiura]|uniref:Glutamate receptor, metabotropic 5 n=1 Tax=Trichuris trichiura TaxID=36087 RepID=A0A077ZDK4_TRITR|nr:glutamate receptor, metabotropic 5 [Trichuris trichiura]
MGCHCKISFLFFFIIFVYLMVALRFVVSDKYLQSLLNSTAPPTHMRVATIPGDLQIGVLFPIHRKIAGTERCGKIWEQYGIQRTEIAMQTVDAINNDRTILPNVQLGISIRDDCWTERIAMEQTIELIRDVVGGRSLHKVSYCSAGSRQTESDQEQTNSPEMSNIVAVIGPGSSDVSIAVQNLLQVFHIPQVGYSATTKALSDKTEFKYYMRVVPSDSWQAKAMVDIVRYFNWSYVAVIYTDGNYGEKGFEELQRNFEEEEGLCIGVSEKIKSLAPPEEYDRLIDSLMSYRPKITVAICFCEGDTIKKIFEATKRVRQKLKVRSRQAQDSLQWIGSLLFIQYFVFDVCIFSESWSDRKDVVTGVEDVATGAYSFRIYSPPVPHFEKYYFSLTPENNKRNPWFIDFWEEKFNCSYRKLTRLLYQRRCKGSENVTFGYKPDPKLSQVVTSIYTVAYALDSMYKDVCTGYIAKGVCPAMVPVDGSKLFQYMLKTEFSDLSGQSIYFDKNGDPPARYDILNYQGKQAGYVTVGTWGHVWRDVEPFNRTSHPVVKYGSKLRIDRRKILWHNRKSGSSYTPVAKCSYECGIGEIKKIQAMKCCWTCVPCFENEYLLNEYKCKECSVGSWPIENRTGKLDMPLIDHVASIVHALMSSLLVFHLLDAACYKLDVEYMRWGDAEAIVCVVFACAGILATLFTTTIFVMKNTTPVVKATTRELSYMILGGLLLCYVTTFIIVTPPCTVTCVLLRVVPCLAFAMIYGALFTKTNRIARILAASKKIITKRRRFLSTGAQVVITCILIGVELVITVVFLILEPPAAEFDHSIPRRVLLVCRFSKMGFFAPFGFDLFLVSMCTLYAIKTRNLPENFNEAKFIGFTMYTTCIVWLAFLAIYFGSNKKDTTMCICFSLSASVALVLLFFPKLYVILWRPEKNVRSYFKTTTTIRCHFGANQVPGSGTQSRVSSISGSQKKRNRTGALRIRSKPGQLLGSGDSYSSYSTQSSPNLSRCGSKTSHVTAALGDLSRKESSAPDQEGRTTDTDVDRKSSIATELATMKDKMTGLTKIQEIPSPSTSPVSMRRSRSLWRKFDPLLRNPELSQRWKSFRSRPETVRGKATPTLLLRVAAERLDAVRQFLDERSKQCAEDSAHTPSPPPADEPTSCEAAADTVSGRVRKGPYFTLYIF